MDIYIDKSDKTKSIFDYNIEGQIVSVAYWYSWREKLTEDEFNDYLQLEALIQINEQDKAKLLAQPKASGSIATDENGGLIDTRNWYQNWLDNNIIGE